MPIIPTVKPAPETRLQRELERERQQRILNHDDKAGLHSTDGDRLKDARENMESGTVRR
jgi:hypothetical protein